MITEIFYKIFFKKTDGKKNFTLLKVATIAITDLAMDLGLKVQRVW